MTTYVDSSALVPLYVPEQFSARARRVVRAAGPLPFTALHRLEVPNAFELLSGRGVLSQDESRAVHRQLQEDIEQQRLHVLSLDLDQVFAEAARLSRAHSATLLTRSLDLLHVAAAHAAGCTRFVSADDRQLALAKVSGFRTVDIKHRRASPKRDHA